MKRLATGIQEGAISKVRFCPNGRYLLAASAWIDSVGLWEVGDDGELIKRKTIGTGDIAVDEAGDFPENRRVYDLAFHPDGKRFAIVGMNRTIEIYEVPNCECIAHFGQVKPESMYEGYTSVIFSGNGKYLLTAFSGSGQSEVYDLETGSLVDSFDSDGYVMNFFLHPEREIIAQVTDSQGWSQIRFLRLAEGFEFLNHQYETLGEIHALSFSPDGTKLAFVSGFGGLGVFVCDFPSFQEKFNFHSSFYSPIGKAAWLHGIGAALTDRCVFSADSAHLFYPDLNGDIVKLDAATGEELHRESAHSGIATTLDIHFETGRLISGGTDDTLQLWQIEPMSPPRLTDRAKTEEFLKIAPPIPPSEGNPRYKPTIIIDPDDFEDEEDIG